MTENIRTDRQKSLLQRLSELVIPILLFSIPLTLFVIKYADPELLPYIAGEVSLVISISLWITGTFLTIRIINVSIWDAIKVTLGYSVPALLRDLVNAIIWFGGLCGIVVFVFDESITHILATSAVILGVIGFTLKQFITDAFAGIVIGLHRPIKEGDWLQFDEVSGIGRVVEINWRMVRIVTPDEITLLVPNSQLIENPIKIYSEPELYFRDEIQITLPFTLTTQQAERILLSAANQVDEVAAIPRTSIVSIDDYTERGILWRLLYWCPHPGKIPAIRFKVHQNIVRNLYYIGIEIPIPKHIVQIVPEKKTVPEDELHVDILLMRIPLFSGLTRQELSYLSTHMETRLCISGHPILRQGDPGDSLFVVREGLLSVRIKDKDDMEIEAGKLSSGQFFGERSLLLGDMRSATIVPIIDSCVSEITKSVMSKLLQSRPEIILHLSEVLSERDIINYNKTHEKDVEIEKEIGTEAIAQKIFRRIHKFFGLQ